jgi:phytoene dehydrogenase-like protein
MSRPTDPVVVVGAGLAGLVAARTLTDAGVDVQLFESGTTAGGRVRTDRVDGYLLDRGFQLYNPAYPEGRRQLDHDRLRLRPLTRGVVVVRGHRDVLLADPRAEPGWAPSALRSGLVGPRGLFHLARYAARVARARPTELTHQPDASAEQALREANLSPAFVEAVLHPFLTGVFLEPDLATSRRFLDLVVRSFLRGTPSVPGLGMQEIPRQLEASLPDGVLHYDREVTSVQPTLVTTRGAPDAKARAVVVATDPVTARHLIPSLEAPRMNAVTTWYHSTDDLAVGRSRPVLHIDGGGRGPVINTVVISHAAPAYAPAGRALVASSTLGTRTDGDAQRELLGHLARLYQRSTAHWEHVGVYPIPHALPAMPPPHGFRKAVALGNGLYVAGDHRDSSSIQGAMVSGRRAARAVLADLGVVQ